MASIWPTSFSDFSCRWPALSSWPLLDPSIRYGSSWSVVGFSGSQRQLAQHPQPDRRRRHRPHPPRTGIAPGKAERVRVLRLARSRLALDRELPLQLSYPGNVKHHRFFNSGLDLGGSHLCALVPRLTFDLFAQRGQVWHGHAQVLSRVERIEVIAFHLLRAVGEATRLQEA